MRSEHGNGMRPPLEESGILGNKMVCAMRRRPGRRAICEGGAGEAGGVPRRRESERVLVPRKTINDFESKGEEERKDQAVNAA